MSSFILYQLPRSEKYGEKLNREKLEGLSIYKSADVFKAGIIPDSVDFINGAISFEFAFEYLLTYPSLEGEKEVKALEKVPVIFLDGVLAIGNCTREIEEKVLRFIEDNFVSNIRLERIKFEEGQLRSLIDSSSDVLKIDVSPARKALKKIDKISCLGRGIQETEIWEEISSEPIVNVKVNITDLPEPARVSFKKNGVITIHNRFSNRLNVLILQKLVEKLVLPFLSGQFQFKLKVVEDDTAQSF